MTVIITDDNYTESTKFDNAHTIDLANSGIWNQELHCLNNVIEFINKYKKLKYIYINYDFTETTHIVSCENGIYKYCILSSHDLEIYINKSYYILEEFLLDLKKNYYSGVYKHIYINDKLISGNNIHNSFVYRKIICHYKNITDEKYVKERIEYTRNSLLKLLIKID